MGLNLTGTDVAALFALPRFDGVVEGNLAAYLHDVSQLRPVVLFVFPPKSAGTFLRTAAVTAVNGQLVRSCYSQGGREAQFYLPTFLQYYRGGLTENVMVTHVHMQARPGNCRFIEALSLKPVTMVRSIPDMLVSSRDMFLKEAGMQAENVGCEVPEDFPEFSEARKAEFLIDMLAPWYVSYYASWLGYAAKEPDRVLVLQYTDFLADPVTALERVTAHSNLPQSRERCTRAMDAVWQHRDEFRYNKGVSGRGREYFTSAQHAQLERMVAQYSVLDAWREQIL